MSKITEDGGWSPVKVTTALAVAAIALVMGVAAWHTGYDLGLKQGAKEERAEIVHRFVSFYRGGPYYFAWLDRGAARQALHEAIRAASEEREGAVTVVIGSPDFPSVVSYRKGPRGPEIVDLTKEGRAWRSR